jgi:hypothetical protein
MIGRNIGLFQSDAILNDMTLLGVGGGNGDYAAPPNTSLGSIGLGYIYADWYAQFNYTTPMFDGFKATAGVFSPFQTVNSGQSAPASKSIPGVQGKASWTGGPLYLSVSALFQKQRGILANTISVPAAPGGALGFGYSSWAVDAGGKVDLGPMEVLGWYYDGRGVGTTGLFFDANDPLTGKKRASNGFLAQITYKWGLAKLGFNYGQSRLERASGENLTAGVFRCSPTLALSLVSPSCLVAKNAKYTAGIYYSLAANLTLTTEATYIESHNQIGQINGSVNYDIGAFLKF